MILHIVQVRIFNANQFCVNKAKVIFYMLISPSRCIFNTLSQSILGETDGEADGGWMKNWAGKSEPRTYI